MLAGLGELLKKANQQNQAVPCFNVFNLDFVINIIQAGEEEQSPVILSLNHDMVEYYSLANLVPTLLAFAKNSSTPVCVHLDHTYDLAIIEEALQLGMKSVMYDGSQLPLEDNISQTKKGSDLAKSYGADLEGEIGSVSYADNDPKKKHIKSILTDVAEAQLMAEQSGVTALAVSIGNVHRLESKRVEVDFNLLEKISEKVNLLGVALVIHGASGIDPQAIRKMATQSSVAKFNIATDMRKRWGSELRNKFNEDIQLYDPLVCSKSVASGLKDQAKYWINLLRD